MQKKGLSTIIITLILIVVSLVAVAIFWVVVRNLISQQSEGISFEKFAISMDIKKVYSPGANDVAVEVERNPGKAELSGINFIFYTESGSELITQKIPIGELETKTFTLTLQNITAADVIKVSIAPIFKANSEIGSIAASYQLTTPMESGSYVCTPNSCSALGYNCGTHVNGTCSGNIDCGTCGTGQSCVSGVCQAGACTPKLSCTSGQCGSWNNGTCSGTLNCGTCPTGQSCNVSGMCVGSSCVPTTCSVLGFNCGTPANGTCSGTLNCGTCQSGYTCSNSSGGTCQAGACIPTTCSTLGYNCGTWGNGTCSGTLNCGSCSGAQICINGHCQATSGLCSDLRLLMHFDQNLSTTPDSSENGNNGVITGATWTSSGRFGGAFHYDGINDYISLSSSPLTNFGQSSVCMWINLENITWAGGSYSQTFLNLYLNDSNQLRMGNNENSPGGAFFASYAYSGTEYGRSTAAGALSSNSWRHVCYTFNRTTLNIYVGGTIPSTSTNTFARGAYNLIGSRATVSGFVNGTIDDLAIWNRSLTSTEISSIYSSGSAISC
jgi:hypothetical protein